LQRPEENVRYASIRALGQVATPAARKALDAAADSHPDAGTRRRARAELRKLSRTNGD
jgi:HEAT repeat protein